MYKYRDVTGRLAATSRCHMQTRGDVTIVPLHLAHNR